MHALTEALRALGVDGAEADHAAEGHLQVSGRTAEAIIEIEMAKRRIEVVAPQQIDGSPPEPDAFRVGSRAPQLGGLGELVGLLGRVLGRVACLLGALLIAGLWIAALGGGDRGTYQYGRAHGGDTNQMTD